MANDPVYSELQLLTETISQTYALPALQERYILHFKRKAATETLPEDAPEGVKEVDKGCKALGVRHVSRFYHVESDYYGWELQRRAFRLLAPSQAHLCKSVVFENTRCPHKEISDPLNSKYYCVIVQYVASINTQKLMNYVRSLKNNEISRKNYNFRLTSAENSFALTGFDYGGVSPIGMKQQIPIVLSQTITELQPPVFYLGAGHVDWKISMPIEDFLKASACFVADLS